MWLLRDRNGKIKYLRPGKTINIGRKQADIVLENDTSISRAHAAITTTLKNQMKTSELLSTCIVKDTNSKYGTFIIRNGVETKATSEGFELQPHDTVKFGLQHHIFKIEYIHFITVISRLSTDHKNKLKEIMDNIGGIVIDCYDDNCTHLTATTATSTNKIISALIAGLPIIDINYWIAVEKAIEADDDLPNPNKFTLPLQDRGVNTQRVSLIPNPARKTLFQGKTFIFFSEQTYKEYKKMIKDAGGMVELRSINSDTIADDLFSDNNILMQIIEDSATDDLAIFNTRLYNQVQQKSLRMIAETEIPLAIVYVSLNQYCNPKYQFKQLIRRKDLKEDTSKVLALDTQDILSPGPSIVKRKIGTSNANKVCIPETNDFPEDNVSQSENYSLNLNLNNTSESNLKHTESNVESKESSTINTDIQKETEELPNRNENINEKCRFNSEPKLVSKVTKECTKTVDINTAENVDSNDLVINKQDSNFIKKQSNNISTKNDNNKGKKRPRENSDFDEMNKIIHSDWKSKESSSSIQVLQKKGNSTAVSERCDNSIEIEHQKKKIKEEKQNSLDKWGFKKSEKKVIDFDLDDLDMDEPKETKNNDLLKDTKSEKVDETNKLCEVDESNKIDKNNSSRSFKKDNTKLSKENIKNWTFGESSKLKNNSTNDIAVKREKNGSFFLRPNITLEPSINTTMDNKAFRKIYNKIPVKRIALRDMKVCTSNT